MYSKIIATCVTGTWRDTIVCKYDKWLGVPSQLSIQLAATLMVNPATAYRMLSDFVQLEEGKQTYLHSFAYFCIFPLKKANNTIGW